MKLPGAAFCRKPDLSLFGALLHGPDAGLLALRRRELVAAVTERDDLRLDRLDADALRKDPAALETALRAQGFFPGRRAVVVDRAKDGLTEVISAALNETTVEDAFLVVTADGLTGRSSLKKLFEGDRRLAALGFWPEPPDGSEIAAMLRERGGVEPEREGIEMIVAAAAEMDPGSVSQLIEKIAVFGIGAGRAPTPEEIAALVPQDREAALDRLVDAVAEGRAPEVGRLLVRVAAGGVQPVQAMIAMGRHLRAMNTVTAGGGRLRMPPMRARAVEAQARSWSGPRLEQALRVVAETDRTLRRPGQRPDRAIVERCLLRLAVMAGAR